MWRRRLSSKQPLCFKEGRFQIALRLDKHHGAQSTFHEHGENERLPARILWCKTSRGITITARGLLISEKDFKDEDGKPKWAELAKAFQRGRKHALGQLAKETARGKKVGARQWRNGFGPAKTGSWNGR